MDSNLNIECIECIMNAVNNREKKTEFNINMVID